MSSEDSASSENPILSLGSRIGSYRVEKLLGRGGMGEVYAVTHVDLETTHALKLIRADAAAGEEARERFRREARVMAKLDHPGILKVDDFGDHAGRLWLRMELATGQVTENGTFVSLDDWMRARGSQPMAPAVVAGLLDPLLKALEKAHAAGLVHRDLKPANVLLTPEGPKIADFGLVQVAGAEWLQTQARLTIQRSRVMRFDGETLKLPREAAGESSDFAGETIPLGKGSSGATGSSTLSLLGTWDYMAPEQKRGEPVDARADLYALGLIGYRLATGRTSLGTKAPSRLVDDLDARWDDFFDSALEESREDRFADAATMRAALPSAGGGSKKVEKKPSETESGGKGKGWLVALLLVFAVAAGGGIWWSQQAPRPVLIEDPVRLESEGEKSSDPADSVGGVLLSLPTISEEAAAELTVTVDGRSVAAERRNDGFFLKDLAPGERFIAVSHPRYASLEKTVTVAAGETVELSLRPELLPGTLLLSVLPAEADWSLWVDGAEVPTDGSEVPIPAGQSFALEVRAEGFFTVERTLAAEGGETIAWEIALERQPMPTPGEVWSAQLPGGVDLPLTWIAPGTFQMGAPLSETGTKEGEQPRAVTLTRGFWLGTYEATQAQWEALMGDNPSANQGPRNPVERVGWDAAMAFCAALTEHERAAGRLPSGFRYTLPSEAQWEYACRAGSKETYYFGSDPAELSLFVNYADRSNVTSFGLNDQKNDDGYPFSAPVGSFGPNPWGLYEMHGNVSEWTRSYYAEAYPEGPLVDPEGPTVGRARVIRGGSWDSLTHGVRAAYRYGMLPGVETNTLGFRLALEETEL